MLNEVVAFGDFSIIYMGVSIFLTPESPTSVEQVVTSGPFTYQRLPSEALISILWRISNGLGNTICHALGTWRWRLDLTYFRDCSTLASGHADHDKLANTSSGTLVSFSSTWGLPPPPWIKVGNISLIFFANPIGYTLSWWIHFLDRRLKCIYINISLIGFGNAIRTSSQVFPTCIAAYKVCPRTKWLLSCSAHV